ncbi:MAG: hypothetical protein Ct9H300mP9_4200 [Candidatus Neomarinimicrobiota bacterium]|nr:MAG: hypothetical protein Ct9H300mP9_4200 [Candidatus Neomarinimicrobiota bacterium]
MLGYDILDQVYNPGFLQQNEYVKRSPSRGFSIILPTLSWVIDNSVFGFTGPFDGYRQNTSMIISPGGGETDMSFQTMKIDMRKYWRFGRGLYTGHSRILWS